MSVCFAQDGWISGKVKFVVHELSGLMWIVPFLWVIVPALPRASHLLQYLVPH